MNHTKQIPNIELNIVVGDSFTITDACNKCSCPTLSTIEPAIREKNRKVQVVIDIYLLMTVNGLTEI